MFQISKINQLMQKEFPEQVYLVDRLVPDAGFTIFSGAPGSYKTFALLELARCVANGQPFLGYFETHQANVLLVDEENGERLLQQRMRLMDVAEHLPIFYTPTTGFMLTDENVEAAVAKCHEYNIRLVIIDSLVRVHGMSENDAKEMATVSRQLRKFTENNIAVIVTHHTRKRGNFHGGAGEAMRGSSEILAAADGHIGVSRKNKFYVCFDQTKQRYAVELGVFEAKVDGDDNHFRFEFVGFQKPQANKDEILRDAVTMLLSENNQLRQKDILDKLGELGVKTNEHKLRSLLATWESEGLLSPPDTGSGNTKLYSLKEVQL